MKNKPCKHPGSDDFSEENRILEIKKLVTGYRTGKKITSRVTGEFSHTIERGAFIAVIGPNGCGKTTLLKTIAGMLVPVSGSVTSFSGGRETPVSQMDAKELARKRAVVLSKPPETGMMSVKEIVSLGRAPYTGWQGKLENPDKAMVGEALALTGTERLSGRIFSKLSDGEKQKVMTARAIAQDTPLVFLDEPTAFLDLPSRIGLYETLSEIREKKKTTIILTTHDLGPALIHSDSIWILDRDGNIFPSVPPGKGGNSTEEIIEKVFGITPGYLSLLK